MSLLLMMPNMSQTTQPYITATEISQLLRCSVHDVRYAIARLEIEPARRVGPVRLFLAKSAVAKIQAKVKAIDQRRKRRRNQAAVA